MWKINHWGIFVIVYLFNVWYTPKRAIFEVLRKIISAWEYSNYNIKKDEENSIWEQIQKLMYSMIKKLL